MKALFRQLLFLEWVRRATDKDHGDPRRGSSRTAKTVRGSGGPWAGGSHLFFASFLGSNIALISLINPTLREHQPPSNQWLSPVALYVVYAEYEIFTLRRLL